MQAPGPVDQHAHAEPARPLLADRFRHGIVDRDILVATLDDADVAARHSSTLEEVHGELGQLVHQTFLPHSTAQSIRCRAMRGKAVGRFVEVGIVNGEL